MEDIVSELKNINDSLQLIAEAILKTSVGADVPAFVKVAQNVLSKANAKVTEAVVEEVKQIETPKATGEASSASDLIVSSRVTSIVTKKNKGLFVGAEGVIVNDNDGKGSWRTVAFTGLPKPTKMRCNELKLLEGDSQVSDEAVPANEEVDNEEPQEASNTENEPPVVSPPEEKKSPGTYLFSSGAHTGKSVSETFHEGGKSEAFVRWFANKGKDEEVKAACADYLTEVGA